MQKKDDAPKEKGVDFKEVVPQKKSTLALARDKGIGILEESSPSAKRQKMTTISDYMQMSSVPEVQAS